MMDRHLFASASSLAGPVRSRTGVRSMTTVTYLSPRRVCRPTCSSTPRTFTPSNRCGSAINTRRPSASTASLAVFHETPSASAILATLKCWHTSAVNAHRRPLRDSRARGWADLLVSRCHTYPHRAQRNRQTVTSRIVGRHPSGSCASRRVVESRSPCWLHRPHVGSRSRTRHASTARSGSRNCPVTCRPSASSRAKVVRSGVAKVESPHEVFRCGGVRTSIVGRPRPLSRQRRADPAYTLICESQFRDRAGQTGTGQRRRLRRHAGRSVRGVVEGPGSDPLRRVADGRSGRPRHRAGDLHLL